MNLFIIIIMDLMKSMKNLLFNIFVQHSLMIVSLKVNLRYLPLIPIKV